MKKFIHSQHRLFFLLTALPCLAFGQGSSGSAGSSDSSGSTGATGSSTSSAAGTNAAGAINTSNAINGAAGTSSTGVKVDANPPGVTNPMSNLPPINGATTPTGSVPGSTGVNATGTVNAGSPSPTSVNPTGTLQPSINSVGASGTAAGSPAASGEATSEEIRNSNFQLRDSLTNSVQSRLENSHQVITANSSRLGQMSGDTRTRYQAALRLAQEREIAVRNSLAAVRSADASSYEAARNRLAQDYDAYVTAIAELETSGASTTPR